MEALLNNLRFVVDNFGNDILRVYNPVPQFDEEMLGDQELLVIPNEVVGVPEAIANLPIDVLIPEPPVVEPIDTSFNVTYNNRVHISYNHWCTGTTNGIIKFTMVVVKQGVNTVRLPRKDAPPSKPFEDLRYATNRGITYLEEVAHDPIAYLFFEEVPAFVMHTVRTCGYGCINHDLIGRMQLIPRQRLHQSLRIKRLTFELTTAHLLNDARGVCEWILKCPLLYNYEEVSAVAKAILADLQPRLIYARIEQLDYYGLNYIQYLRMKYLSCGSLMDCCRAPSTSTPGEFVGMNRHLMYDVAGVDRLEFELNSSIGYSACFSALTSNVAYARLQFRFAGSDADSGGAHFYGTMMNEIRDVAVDGIVLPESIRHNTCMAYINELRRLRYTARLTVPTRGILVR